MRELIRVETLRAGVSGLTLLRAERRNALSIALMEQICGALDSLAEEETQRVLIVRGDGPVFCAGLDLQEAQDEQLEERSAACVEQLLMRVRSSPLVTIAAVQGGAFAGGAGLMAACDIVVAAEDARIGFPEARRGLLPALISNVLKTRVREGDLREMLLTGEPINAARAREIGLVQRVVHAADLLAEALRGAESILAGGPDTIRATKRLLAELYGVSAETSRGSMSRWHLEARRSSEAREGLQAYLEKRDPEWMRRNQP